MDSQDDLIAYKEGPKTVEAEETITISAKALQEKLQHLVAFNDPQFVISEVRRFATTLSHRDLKREIESKPRAVINKMPVELLAGIFELVQSLESKSDYGVPTSQLIMASVCQRWRDVATQTAALWRKILIRESEPYPQTRLWLQRSGTAPLFIVLDWTEDGDGPARWVIASWSKVYKLLKAEMHRVQSLLFAVDDQDIIFAAVKSLQLVEAPQLSRLELSHYEELDPGRDPGIMVEMARLFTGKDGKTVPRPLENVTLWGIHCDWSSSLFSHLRSLTLAYHHEDVRPTTTEFFNMITSSSDVLEHLTLECSGPADPTDAENWPTEAISLPALRELKLAFIRPALVQSLLLVLDAPTLSHLHLDLDDEYNDSTADWNRVVEVLCTGGYLPTTSPRNINRKRGKPLFPNLTSLIISALPCTSEYLSSLFLYHPQVVELRINFNYLDPDLWLMSETMQHSGLNLPQWLSQTLESQPFLQNALKLARETPGVLLPNLKTFRAHGLDGETMRSFVEGRKSAGYPLKELYYSDESSIKKSDRTWLRANLEVFEEFEDTDDEDEEVEDEEEDEEGEGDEEWEDDE